MIEDYMKPYVTALVHSLDAMFDVEYTMPLDDQGEPRFEQTSQLNPDHKYWVCVGFHGIITGEFLLAIESTDWAEILEDLVDDEEELKEMLPASLKEMLNVAAGKAVAVIQNDFPGLTLFSPKVMEGKMDYPESSFFTCFLQHGKYHPIEVTLCINTMQQKLGIKLEEEIKQRAVEAAKAKKTENNIRSIMENLTQGIFNLDFKGIISPGCSKQLEKLFFVPLNEIEERNFVEICPSQIIGPYKESFIEWLDLGQMAPSSMSWEDILQICPLGSEITFNQDSKTYTYTFNFARIEEENDQLMVIINDVTKERELVKKLAEEEAHHAMIIKIALDRDGFILLLRELHTLFLSVYSLLALPPSEIDADELFRYFHTIKGGCAGYELRAIVEAAHVIEGKLASVRSGQEIMTESMAMQILNDTLEFHSLLKQIIIDLSNIIPEEEQGGRELLYKVRDSKIVQLKEFLWNKVVKESLESLKSELEMVIKEPIDDISGSLLDQMIGKYRPNFENSIEALRKQPIGFMLHKYAATAKGLANELNKPIQVEIRGEDVEVSFDKLGNLFSSLVHLVRNCVEHGLEEPAIRALQEKPETGTITLEAIEQRGELKLIIADDGRGINPEAVKNVALKKGIINENYAQSVSQDELTELIFTPGFSSVEETSRIPGPGVGMDVVKATVHDLNGAIHVKSRLNQGSTFEIVIPITSEELLYEYSKGLHYAQFLIERLQQMALQAHTLAQIEAEHKSAVQLLLLAISEQRKTICEQLFKMLRVLENTSDAQAIAYVLTQLASDEVDQQLQYYQHFEGQLKWIEQLSPSIFNLLTEKPAEFLGTEKVSIPTIPLQQLLQKELSPVTVLHALLNKPSPVMQSASLYLLSQLLPPQQADQEALSLLKRNPHWLVEDLANSILEEKSAEKSNESNEHYRIKSETIFQKLLWFSENSFFNHLTLNTIIHLAEEAQVRLYPEGGVICEQGEPSDELLLICSGEADVIVKGKNEEKTVLTLSFGETIGELGALTHAQRSAKVIATKENSTLMALDGWVFENILNEDTKTTLSFLKLVTKRLQETTRKFSA